MSAVGVAVCVSAEGGEVSVSVDQEVGWGGVVCVVE